MVQQLKTSNKTTQTLLEQMGLNEYEIEQRKQLFGFEPSDAVILRGCIDLIEAELEGLLTKFHDFQTGVPEIVQLIGDSDTMARLSSAQSRYILQLFSGDYGISYVNDILRIGMVHKRIGVEPKLYFSAMLELKNILFEVMRETLKSEEEYDRVTRALEKLLMFDNTLVFDTYIHSLVSEVQIARIRAEEYARELELKVMERTKQLEEQSRTDPLTGLLNVRHLQSIMNQVLKAAQRRNEAVCFIYMDIDNFKPINDELGHLAGDKVLKDVASLIQSCCREEDRCFRYGGDEFCILLPNCDAKQAEKVVCERIRVALEKEWESLEISMGLADTRPPAYSSTDELIRKADAAMYANKKRHKAAKAKKDDDSSDEPPVEKSA
ncbi:GGDEF domain-containing protein [Shewanella submarina]|uniref:Diguanylate cyclase DosC n=1 Tax=Shewanella submarina TaxID=2016376 RepID=A0ABV7GCT7_9GAMM|nr:GGDEF domain-containing protein [Shewanella submarina]MCL1039535.1 GGDEF domain-containing protein [Shewanella submarina]